MAKKGLSAFFVKRGTVPKLIILEGSFYYATGIFDV